MFNSSLSKGIVPTEWKLSNVTPFFKSKGDPSCVANYRPISLLSLPSTILEQIIHNRLLIIFCRTTFSRIANSVSAQIA